MRKLILSIFTTLSFIGASAQSNWCAADLEYQNRLKSDPSFAQQRAEMEEQVDRYLASNYSDIEKAAADTMTVPLVIHIIHDGDRGNISKEQVLDGIRILNEDYLRINEDTSETRDVFKPYASGVNIQFKLAKIDPQGNCTEGIIRIDDAETSNSASPRDNVKELSQWPENKYFNVWIVNSIDAQGSAGTVLGYGEFPTPGLSNTYGFVNIHQAWGQIGTGIYGGRTPTHEIGHCLNLYHTFQSGCGSTCENSGDRVCDTPPTSEATYGCNQNQNTCANDLLGASSAYNSNVVDQIENYMSYDGCQNMFTLGQRDRMIAAIQSNNALQNLISQSNLEATGTNNGYVEQNCAPIAAFTISKNTTCAGSSIIITDRTYNSSGYTRNWSFPGADVTTSTDSIVTISYADGGLYDISLTATNTAGTNTFNLSEAVTVGSTTPAFTDYMSEEFSSGTLPNGWSVNNPTGVGFEMSTTTGFEDATSITLNNRVNPPNQVDEIILPVFTVSGTTSPTFNFFHAFAPKVSSNTDVLNVYVSSNCGQSWIRRKSMDIEDLTTSGNSNTAFTPSNLSEWKEASLSLAAYRSKDYLLIKLEFISGGGNNLYLDKFTIGDQVGINELAANTAVNVVPNPVNNQATIKITSLDNDLVNYEIVDMLGRTLSHQQVNLVAGDNAIAIDMSNEQTGVYFIRIHNAKGLIQHKFMKH
ncbi:MAG: hypothetical protein ACI8ZO_000365 [Flavobacteriales bacterium]|jgi:hypothetical protein